MTLVSIKEFSTNQEKYFSMALNERIFIKNGNHTFFVTHADENESEYDDLIETKRYANGSKTTGQSKEKKQFAWLTGNSRIDNPVCVNENFRKITREEIYDRKSIY